MAVVQISRIQQRRGLAADLQQNTLASAELGWSVDTRELWIGNGTTEEGAPTLGKTQILTEYSILNFESSYTANILALQSNVAALSNIVALGTTTQVGLSANASSAVATTFSANNGIISYSMNQGGAIRTGTITFSRQNSTVTYVEEYTETTTTDIVFTMNASVTSANLNYSSTNSADLRYSISTH